MGTRSQRPADGIGENNDVVHRPTAVRVLFLINAHHGIRQTVNLHLFSHRVHVIEKGLRRPRPQNADLLILLNVQQRQVAALFQLKIVANCILIAAKVKRGRHFRVLASASPAVAGHRHAAAHVSHSAVSAHFAAVFGSVNHGGGKLAVGRHAVHTVVKLQAEIIQVLKHILPVAVTGIDGNLVGAHGRHHLHAFLVGPVDDRDNGHNGGNADDDAKHRQGGPALVSQNGFQRHFQRLPDFHSQSTSWGRSSIFFPSARRTTLRAVAAMPCRG
ncbi:hypothetical protein SDC9_141488 [bioreactor metagenome]|uniref:Uncharacterized protein n=1 Tax=bioreactor metagenome TaxID=1076179 RepID=A0A645E178_9ZZZZ